MSFMMKIDAARCSPLDQLAIDYGLLIAAKQAPSIYFFRCAAGVPDTDEVVARRLFVSVILVRGWREIGRRLQGART